MGLSGACVLTLSRHGERLIPQQNKQLPHTGPILRIPLHLHSQKALEAVLTLVQGEEQDVEAQTWNNRLVPNWEKSTSRLCIVTLLINFYAEYIMQNADRMKHKLDSRFLGDISLNSGMQMTPPLWQKAKGN